MCKAVPGLGMAGMGVQKGMQEGAAAFKRLFCRKIPYRCQEKSNRQHQGEKLSQAKALETYPNQRLVALGWDGGQHLHLSWDVTDRHLFSGLLLGKEHHDHPSGTSLPPPLPSLSCMPVPVPVASHAKTGSKDSSTQTDKSTELFWPAAASFPGRGRLGTTPSHSPAPRPPGTRVAGEKLGELCRIPVLVRNTSAPRAVSRSPETPQY